MLPHFAGNWMVTESFRACFTSEENQRQYPVEITQTAEIAAVEINAQTKLNCQVITTRLHCWGSIELEEGRQRNYASYDLAYTGNGMEGEAFWSESGGGCDDCNGRSDLNTSAPPQPGPAPTPATVTNRFQMAFNLILAGTFNMGSPETELGREGEEDQHQVQLTSDYYLQTTEVTQAQWEDVLIAAQELDLISEEELAVYPSHFSDCGRSCPVESVSWEQATHFITVLNQLDPEGNYTLPTEAQWEYAARAGSQTAFANGDITERNCDHDPNLDLMGWYCGNADGTPQPSSQKLPNAFGLFDMHGNVNEWCHDWHGPYPITTVIDPLGPADGNRRVYRGGSWHHDARRNRSAYRDRRRPDDRESHLGFRLVWVPEQS